MGIRLHLLGGLHLYDGDRELDWIHGQRLRAALLVHLAVEREVSRAALLGLFWPESDEESARHALRQNLYRLKQDIGRDSIVSRAHDIRVSNEIETDVQTFQMALERGDLERGTATYAGGFLDGVFLVDLKPWETWVDTRRAELGRAFRKACRECVEQCRSAGDHAGAIEAALRWVAPDPEDDEAQHVLIAALADAGRRTDAIRQYETYARTIGVEGLEPLDETKALYARIVTETAVGPGRQTSVVEPSEEPRSATAAATPRSGRSRLRIALVGTVSAVGAIVLALALIAPAPEPSSFAERAAAQRFLVLPFEVHGGEAGTWASFLPHVQRAFDRWWEIEVVADPPPSTDEETRRVDPRVRAEQMAADAYVRTVVEQAEDSVRIAMHFMPVGTGRAHLAVTRAVTLGATDDPSAALAELADTLLLRAHGLAALDAGNGATLSLVAYERYMHGRTAMARFDLLAADTAFASAAAVDPAFADALVALAQTRAWRDEPPTGWTFLLEEALGRENGLSSATRSYAEALLRMGRREWTLGCNGFAAAGRSAWEQFAALFDGGRCMMLDPVVVPDSTSRSGWSYRSSYARGWSTHVQALSMRPAAYSVYLDRFDRLERLMFTRDARMRIGESPDGGIRFFAYPVQAGDTITFVPFPDTLFHSGAAVTLSSSSSDALLTQRKALFELAGRVRAIFPGRIESSLLMVRARELLADPTAVQDLRVARRRADRDSRIGLAAAEVLLLVKFALPDDTASLMRARAIADSILGVPTPASAHDRVASLAALTGRLADAESRVRRQSRSPGNADAAQPHGDLLLMYSAAGGPLKRIEAIERELEHAIRNGFEQARQRDERVRWIGRAATLAYPDRPAWRGLDPPGDYLIELQQRDEAGDSAAVLRILDELADVRARLRPAEVQFQILLPEARLLMGLGHMEEAAERLRPALSSIEWRPPDALADRVESLSLLRAMLLMADLAIRRGDTEEGGRWLRPLEILWSDADDVLRSEVRRLRSFLQ